MNKEDMDRLKQQLTQLTGNHLLVDDCFMQAKDDVYLEALMRNWSLYKKVAPEDLLYAIVTLSLELVDAKKRLVEFVTYDYGQPIVLKEEFVEGEDDDE